MIVQLAIILSLVVFGGIAGGGAIWHLKTSAIQQCNTSWKEEIADANLKLEKANEAKAAALSAAEAQGALRLARTEQALAEAKQSLELAKAATPLSAPCDECRIPAARLRNTSKRRSSSGKAPAIIRHKSKPTPAPQGDGLLKDERRGLHGPGT